MNPDEIELQRRITDARAWLREGYVTKGKVDALIAKLRGQEAAELLRDDMRAQWRCCGEWLRSPE